MKTNPSAEEVKNVAKELGADLVGIASAETLNAFPPDPKWPQVPANIAPDAKSAIVLVKRVPVAGFRTKKRSPYHMMTVMVLRRLDKIASRLAEYLEDRGHFGIVAATNSTSWDLKHGTYGHLSLRHLGVEAGLGTLGLGVSFLSPEYGPRVYLGAVLTDCELEADRPMTEQMCIGEGCSRCVHGCPTDSIRHFGLDKRNCSPEAQVSGFAGMTTMFAKMVEGDRAAKKKIATSGEFLKYWQSLMRVAGCFACCPRCSSVCPIGDDYHAHLAEPHHAIPEKTDERVLKGREFQAARKFGDDIPGLNEWNIRWVGREGFSGAAAKAQRRKFAALQEERKAGSEGEEE